MMTLEQCSDISKSNLETIFCLSNKALDGIWKMHELNTQAIKACCNENIDNSRQAIGTKDPHDFFSWCQMNIAKTVSENAPAYMKQACNIATQTQAELAKAAESQCSDYINKLQACAENLAQNTPVGSENAANIMKAALNAGSAICGSACKAAKQVSEMADASLQAAVQATSQAASSATTYASQQSNQTRSKK